MNETETVVPDVVDGCIYEVNGERVTAEQFAAHTATENARMAEEDAVRAVEIEKISVDRRAAVKAALVRINTGKASAADIDLVAGVLG